jgi:GntR family transcriptional regulator
MVKERKTYLKRDTRPLYDQAIEALHHFIADRGCRPGDRLPGEEELSKELGISRPTLREAMGRLEGQGVITRRHGVGAFVTAPPQGAMQDGLEHLHSLHTMAALAGVPATRADWLVELSAADERLAARLEVPPGASLAHVQITSRAGERTIAYLDSYVPAGLVDLAELQTFPDGSLLDYLIEKGAPAPSYTYTDLFAVNADERLARWLHVPAGQSLLLLQELFYSGTGQPFVWSENYFLTDLIRFHIIRRIAQRA